MPPGKRIYKRSIRDLRWNIWEAEIFGTKKAAPSRAAFSLSSLIYYVSALLSGRYMRTKQADSCRSGRIIPELPDSIMAYNPSWTVPGGYFFNFVNIAFQCILRIIHVVGRKLLHF